MAESADALDSGSSRGNSVEVQVLLSAPTLKAFVYAALSVFSLPRNFNRITYHKPKGVYSAQSSRLPNMLYLQYGKHRYGGGSNLRHTFSNSEAPDFGIPADHISDFQYVKSRVLSHIGLGITVVRQHTVKSQCLKNHIHLIQNKINNPS